MGFPIPPTMKRLLFAASLLSLSALAADPNYAIQPVPRDAPWMKRHEGFNVISKQGEAPLVFLGDSITQGWSGKGKATWEKYYTPRKAANFGIGGDRTEHVLWRLDHGNFDGLSPKLIVLMIGTNNTGHVGRPQKELNGATYQCSAEQTAEGVKQILEALKKKCPKSKILLLGIFPRGEKPSDAMRRQNEATNALIAKFADGQTVQFLDIGQTFLQPDGTLTREIMPDLLHLSEAGYDKWAAALEPKVKELLGE
jgi:lysophospholipase L1-like esterase